MLAGRQAGLGSELGMQVEKLKERQRVVAGKAKEMSKQQSQRTTECQNDP